MLIRQDPMHNFRMLQGEINRLFERDTDPSYGVMSQWPLRVDICEDGDSIILQADVPGVEQKDIKVHVENNQLTISGERQFEDEKKRDSYHRVERSYGAFSRTFELGGTADAEKIKASCKNGVLTVSMPKREGAKPKSIEVQVHG
ncbi:MAG: Hsp20/alpha crystallin family protein [Magnetococcales bacterium]|nr:Hsp20/alpha crystallin family protein [Magnetococcales bacterium]